MVVARTLPAHTGLVGNGGLAQGGGRLGHGTRGRGGGPVPGVSRRTGH
jgi:hypothetical protein